MVGKVPYIAPTVDVLLANLEDAIPAAEKETARSGLVEIAKAWDHPDTQLWTRVNSLASAKADRAVPADTVALGEVGLGGEVRQAAQAPRRLAEVLRLGFRRAIVPASTPDVRGLELVRVTGVRDAMGAVGLA